MPIQIPDLGNRTFDDLMKEMRAAIPKYTREWTDFNPADPGMVILELLAWISETLLYRANQVPESLYLQFLRLIAGSGIIIDPTDRNQVSFREYVNGLTNRELKAEIPEMRAAAEQFLNSRYRAVTKEDFRGLTLEASSDLKRVEVFPKFTGVEIVIIPEYKNQTEIETLIETVTEYLEPRRLLGTVITVKGAEYKKIGLRVTLVCESYANTEIGGGPAKVYLPNDQANGDTVEDLVARLLYTYLDPIIGGPEGRGWAYGRTLTIYELFHKIEKIDVIDHVAEISKLKADTPQSEISKTVELEAERWETFKNEENKIVVTGLIVLERLEVKIKGESDE